MLVDYALPQFLSLRKDSIFQERDASAHYSSRVRRHLNDKRWTVGLGEEGLFSGYPVLRIKLLVNFPSVQFKEKVYAARVGSVEYLTSRI